MLNNEEIQIIQTLEGKQFIGAFPGCLNVLLVPVSTAIEELSLNHSNLTEATLRKLLKKHNILIFNNVEDWARYKGISNDKNKRRRFR